MADSGQPQDTPPATQPPDTPAWAPTPDLGPEDGIRPAAQPSAPVPPPGPATTPYSDVAATMRLIPVPPASTPPPPIPAFITTPPTPAGERYIGKYRVKGELGRGGMGAVYLAEQPGLGREVAIKELIQSAAADPVALKRFLQEAQVMARTSHPNLVQVHDLELMGDANYIVLEFVRGKSLRDWLNRGPIPLPQVFAVMHGVLQALDYAHKHAIVHRDMKPENVLLSDEGMVKVADFGIARLTDDSGVAGAGRLEQGGRPQRPLLDRDHVLRAGRGPATVHGQRGRRAVHADGQARPGSAQATFRAPARARHGARGSHPQVAFEAAGGPIPDRAGVRRRGRPDRGPNLPWVAAQPRTWR